MSIVYAETCDCDLIAAGRAFPGLRILRVSTPQQALAALRRADAEWTTTHYEERPAAERYHSIHGPGGHVMRVIP